MLIQRNPYAPDIFLSYKINNDIKLKYKHKHHSYTKLIFNQRHYLLAIQYFSTVVEINRVKFFILSISVIFKNILCFCITLILFP